MTQKSQGIKNYSENYSKIFPKSAKSGIRKALFDSYESLRTHGENIFLDEVYSISRNSGYSHLDRAKKIKDKINGYNLDEKNTLILNKYLNVYNTEVMSKRKVTNIDDFKKQSDNAYKTLYSKLEEKADYEERFVPTIQDNISNIPISNNKNIRFVPLREYVNEKPDYKQAGFAHIPSWQNLKNWQKWAVGIAGAAVIGFGGYFIGKNKGIESQQPIISEKQAIVNVKQAMIESQDISVRRLEKKVIEAGRPDKEVKKEVEEQLKKEYEKIAEQTKQQAQKQVDELKAQYENCISQLNKPEINKLEINKLETIASAANLDENKLIQKTSAYAHNFEAKYFESEPNQTESYNANWEDRMNSIAAPENLDSVGDANDITDFCEPFSRTEGYPKWLMNKRADMYSQSGRRWEAGLTKFGGLLSNLNQAGRWLTKNSLGRLVNTFTKEKGEKSFQNASNFFWRNAPLGQNSNASYVWILENGTLGVLDFDTRNDPYVYEDGLAGIATQVATHWMLWEAIDCAWGDDGGHKSGGFTRDGGAVNGEIGRGGGAVQ